MALSGRLKADFEYKAPVDKVHEFYTCMPYLLSKTSPGAVHSVDLIEGQWGKDGSVYCWNFVLDGKPATMKVKVGMDFKNRSTTCKAIESTLFKMFKSFTINIQVSPRDHGCSVMTWNLEYEKLNANVDDPNSLLQSMLAS